MAMVRMGDTRLSVDSALMIACRQSRAVSCQATQSSRPGKMGPLNPKGPHGGSTPSVSARKT